LHREKKKNYVTRSPSTKEKHRPRGKSEKKATKRKKETKKERKPHYCKKEPPKKWEKNGANVKSQTRPEPDKMKKRENGASPPERGQACNI